MSEILKVAQKLPSILATVLTLFAVCVNYANKKEHKSVLWERFFKLIVHLYHAMQCNDTPFKTEIPEKHTLFGHTSVYLFIYLIYLLTNLFISLFISLFGREHAAFEREV